MALLPAIALYGGAPLLVAGAATLWIGMHRINKRTTWGHLAYPALTPWQQGAQKEEFRVALSDPAHGGDRMIYRSGWGLLMLGILLIGLCAVAEVAGLV